MTDKVQKIREEVEKLKSNLIYGACSSLIAMETRCKEEAYNEVLAILDTMQEEPVSIWHDASKKSDNPEDVVIINPSDNTGEVLAKCIGVNQGHIWAYTSELLKLDNPCNIGKNLQEPQVKESTKIQHVNETCKNSGDSITQEPVSDDLNEAAIEYFKEALSTGNNSKLDAFRAGANWQKQKDNQNESDMAVIAHLDGVEKGKAIMKQQMLKDAIDGDVTFGYYEKDKTYGCVAHNSFCLEDRGLKDRDKVKLIIIKED